METLLVTGGAGYIGSVLTRLLLQEGYKVKCLDRLFFGKESIEELLDNPNFELIIDDIRSFQPENLNDVDAVIDMAALSNDPAGELNPEIIQMLPKGKSFIEKEIFPKLAREGKLYGYKYAGQWFATDTIERYQKAMREWKGIK